MNVRPTPLVIQPPAQEPVSLADAKGHCIVSGSDDDALLTRMIAAARRNAEHRTQASFIARELELRFDAFPLGAIELAQGPVSEIKWVKYTDTTGVEQTLDPSAYVLDAAAPPGYVLPAYDTEWPDTRSTPNAVRVRYVAGFGVDPTDVPEDVRAWLLITVATLYQQREAFVQGTIVAELPNRFVDSLLDAYSRVTV